MNAIATHLASAYFLHQQEVKLLERFGHARQKPAFFQSRLLSRASALFLGDHPKAAIGYHFKTGHRETA
jgi:hypothetical protein